MDFYFSIFQILLTEKSDQICPSHIAKNRGRCSQPFNQPLHSSAFQKTEPPRFPPEKGQPQNVNDFFVLNFSLLSLNLSWHEVFGWAMSRLQRLSPLLPARHPEIKTQVRFIVPVTSVPGKHKTWVLLSFFWTPCVKTTRPRAHERQNSSPSILCSINSCYRGY